MSVQSRGFFGYNPWWKSKDGHLYFDWKEPIFVAPGATPYRTVTVVSPTSARLLFTSPARWVTAWNHPLPVLGRAVRLSACGRDYASYFGAIMVRRDACVTLAVAGPDGKLGTVSVPVRSAQC